MATPYQSKIYIYSIICCGQCKNIIFKDRQISVNLPFPPHAFATHSLMLVSHLSPVKPGGQMQLTVPPDVVDGRQNP